MRLFFLAVLMNIGTWVVSPAVASVAAPDADLVRGSDERIQVRLGRVAAGTSGYNVYRDGRYFTTLRPGTGATAFAFDGAGGSYCLVAFVESAGSTQYSSCGISRQVSNGPPAPPTRVRARLHSAGVADIVWSASRDHVALLGYEVRRDGQRIAFHKGRSVFLTDLSDSQVIDVVAVDRAGRRSQSARYLVGGSNERRGSTRSVISVSSIEQPRSSVGAGDGRRLGVAIDVDRPVLHEGATDALRIPIHVSRATPRGTITMSLDGLSDADDDGISYRFEPAHLGYGATETTLVMRMSVAMAARLEHARQFDVKADDGSRRVGERLVVDVKPTSAHDVYLLIGQSNMVGYSLRGAKQAGVGEPDEPHPRIRQLNVRENSRRHFADAADFSNEQKNVGSLVYTRAEDPLHDPRRIESAMKNSTFIGPGLSFAKALLPRTSSNIYLVPAAWSATGFCANRMGDLAWNASPNAGPGLGGTLLLERALTRLNQTLRDTGGIFRGILWHQGGADSNNRLCADSYANNLRKMVQRIRREARPDLRGPSARGNDAAIPFIAATMSRGIDARGDFSDWSVSKRRVDSVHRRISSLIPYADVVDNDDLVPPQYPCGQSSCVHFGADAVREQGRRFGQALQRIIARGSQGS